MDELIAFVRRCLDDDERVALVADPGPWEVGPTFGARDSRVYVREADHPGIDTIGTCVIAGQVANKTRFRENAQHIARWDPARVLAEAEAKRARIAWLLDLEHEPGPEGFPTWESCRLRWTEDMAGDEEIGYCSCGLDPWRNQLFRFEAQPYAGRDGWREEWRVAD